MIYQQCSKCRQEKPATVEFWHRRRGGLAPCCKVCVEEYDRAHYQKVKAHRRHLSAAWYQRNKEIQRQRCKQWALNNLQRKREMDARYYALHKAHHYAVHKRVGP
jgi:hypothetical protein